MQFNFTIPDQFIPRIEEAFGLVGTAAEKKAQFEDDIKQLVLSRVADKESTVTAEQKRVDLTTEFEGQWWSAIEKARRAARQSKIVPAALTAPVPKIKSQRSRSP